MFNISRIIWTLIVIGISLFIVVNLNFKDSLIRRIIDLLQLDYVTSESKNLNKIEIKTQTLKPEKLLEPAFSILFLGDIPKFNPIQPDGLYVWQLQALVWDRFVEIDKQKIWHESLATDWTFNEDQTELSLQLRPNIKWSDGRSLSEQDIEFSLNFYKLNNLKGALFQPLLARVQSFELKDSILTLKLSLNVGANPTYASKLYWSEILSSLRLLPFDFATNPFLGTGLYKIHNFSNHKPWSLVLNENSWLLNSNSLVKWPEEIRIQTYRSQNVIYYVLKSMKQNASSFLVMGQDLYNIGLNPEDLSVFPLESILFTKAIRFNLKKISFTTRKKLQEHIFRINDLDKLNLKNKFKDFKIFNSLIAFNSDKQVMGEPVLSSVLPQKINFKDYKSSELISVEVIYSNDDDTQWLSYLGEGLKNVGYKLDFKLLSSAVLNERIFKKDFESYILDYESQPFFPLYLSLHSKGEYNFLGWSSKYIDKNLELLIFEKKSEIILSLTKNIFQEMHKSFFEIPVFSYKSSVLWTRNRCNQPQKQFQGLGLIYKAIICADNL